MPRAWIRPRCCCTALRIALIGRIWLLATGVPEFSPRHGLTRDALFLRILRLDVPASLGILGEVFPASPDPDRRSRLRRALRPVRRPPRYQREHALILQPIARLFEQLREIGTAITHHVGAFG